MPALKGCHNCRKRRLRCDRSVPECHKCSSTGRKCLGYGKLYKWIDNVGSRGRITGENTFSSTNSSTLNPTKPSLESTPYSILYSSSDDTDNVCETGIVFLVDPLFQDLELSSRYYLNYFDARFCQDLVIYDSPGRGANPFRDLIPMSQVYPFLQHIIVATSAIHYSNAIRRSHWDESPRAVVNNALIDALHARHRAIKSLQIVIERQTLLGDVAGDPEEKDALLAAVLFFVNFSLLDSGKGGWRDHMKIVKELLNMRTSSASSWGGSLNLHESRHDYSTNRNISCGTTPCLVEPSIPLQYSYATIPFSRPITVHDYIASDSTAYIIWMSVLESLVSSSRQTCQTSIPFAYDTGGVVSTLLRTEANSYHSCPSFLLYILLRASCLARAVKSEGSGIMNDRQMQSFIDLFQAAQDFDADFWAVEMSAQNAQILGHVDELELQYRRHISTTYRAAVCLYVLLVAPELQAEIHRRASHGKSGDSLPTFPNTDDLAATILRQLSFIPTNSPLFKFATWPLFLTGVETADAARRAWVLERLRDMRDLCPWGMLTSTMETLMEIWQLRDNALTTQVSDVSGCGLDGQSLVPQHRRSDSDWLLQLRDIEIDCLIV
ncbi:fungal-specific transcription factor domain-containing protein [Xylariaceae sp. FL0662B]|nr:fungal-specific transcription factor domain-containing protein [Xylariaceae sp. FL0662B]